MMNSISWWPDCRCKTAPKDAIHRCSFCAVCCPAPGLHGMALGELYSINALLQQSSMHVQHAHTTVQQQIAITWPSSCNWTHRLHPLHTHMPPPCQVLVHMQSQLSDGDYDPSASRILHLVANPRAEMDRLQDKALLDQYKEENEQLKQALARAAAAAGTARLHQIVAVHNSWLSTLKEEAYCAACHGLHASLHVVSSPYMWTNPKPTLALTVLLAMCYAGSAGQAAAANSSGSGMASAGAGNAVDPAVAAAVAAAEVKLTTRKLQEANKQNDRLKSMFKHHAQAFRDGCRSVG
eukprot:GHRR01010147.1.p1 GENE.GHRR01010147.1~~GHRR01010147.1.p1  ORF type:complete len:294 (-),score=88.61 GHRR01010147.1:1110-1991(-)